MNCTMARQQMALRVGNDLSQSGVFQVERHLLTCPQCRELYERLEESSEVLVAMNSAPPEQLGKTSLLARIEAQLPEPALEEEEFVPRYSRFFDGALRVSVIAASVMLMVSYLPSFLAQQNPRQAMQVQGRWSAELFPASTVRYYPDMSWQSLEQLEPVEEGGEALRNVSY